MPVLNNKEQTNTGFIKSDRFLTRDKSAKDGEVKNDSKIESKQLSEDEGVSSKSESTECEDVEDMVVIVTVATRGTSPTAPSSTAFLRARRNDAVKVVEKDITRPRKRPEVKNAETQSERDDNSRYMSYRSSRSGAPWVSYLDKYSSYPSTRTYGNSTSRIGNYLYSRSENANSHSTKCENLKNQDQDSQQKTEPRFKSRDKTPSQTDINNVNQVPKSTEPKENGVKVEEKEPSFEKKPLVRSARTSPRSSPVTKSDKSDSSRSSSRTESTKSDSRKDSQSDSKSRSSPGKVPSRQLSRADSTESSVSGPTAKSRTSSASSTSSSAKIKTPPSPAKSPVTSVNAKSVSSIEARGKPPVPKPGEMANKSTVNGGAKYVNKDFRKSALNMENGDPSRSQMERKKLKKRSSSSSSAPDSEDSKSSAVTSSRLSGRSKSSVSAGIQKFSTPKKSSLKSESSTETLTRSKSDSSGKKRVSASNTDDSESDESSSDDGQCKAGSEGSAPRPRGTPESSFGDRGKMSAASSRTSVLLASSADELCLTDKPPLPKSRPEGQTEEAKSFLVRALAPVTQFFRSQTDESDKTDDWLDDEHDRSALAATQNVTSNFSLTSPEPEQKSYYSLNRQFSEDKPWWLDPNSDNVPEGIEVASCNDDISQDTTISTVLPDDGKRFFWFYIRYPFMTINTSIKSVRN